MQRIFTFKVTFLSPSLLFKLPNFVTQLFHTKLSTKLIKNGRSFQTFGWKLFNCLKKGQGCWPTSRSKKSARTCSPTAHYTDAWRADSPFHLLTFTPGSSDSNSWEVLRKPYELAWEQALHFDWRAKKAARKRESERRSSRHLSRAALEWLLANPSNGELPHRLPEGWCELLNTKVERKSYPGLQVNEFHVLYDRHRKMSYSPNP